MSIFHLSVKNISRSKGQSVVVSASYRSGTKLERTETNECYDYTNKKEVVWSEIFLCSNAPDRLKNRELLWNEVEKVEKASDSRLAREFEVAIPNELTLDESKELIKNFSKTLTDDGMIVDSSIHWKSDNHHAHILTTTRPIKENGEWGVKEKKVYANDYDENHNPIFNPSKSSDIENRLPVIDESTGEQKTDSRNRKLWKRVAVDSTGWNRTEKVEEWRTLWENECNKFLSSAEQIDHRSFLRQGKEQIPTIHEGYYARKIEQQGLVSERCEYNRQVKEHNSLLDKIKSELSNLTEKALNLFKGINMPFLSKKTDMGELERQEESPMNYNENEVLIAIRTLIPKIKDNLKKSKSFDEFCDLMKWENEPIEIVLDDKNEISEFRITIKGSTDWTLPMSLKNLDFKCPDKFKKSELEKFVGTDEWDISKSLYETNNKPKVLNKSGVKKL